MDLIPLPKFLEEKDGFLSKRTVCLQSEIVDLRVQKAAQKLPQSADGIPFVLEIGVSNNEAYTLAVDEDKIRLTADGAKGAFYGIQTLRQIFTNETIPCLYIKDEPDMEYRGFMQDITRGQILKLDRFKQLVDDMAYYKLNALQLNVEHTFAFREFMNTVEKTGCMTAEEVRELDDYCYENFVELSPAIASFGHLYMLLENEEYRHLQALEDYKPEHIYWIERMIHHTIDPLNPESLKLITGLFDQCMPLFRSKRFNICCDETFDLAHGKHKDKDTGKLYVDFVKQLVDYLQAHGKTVMMWADILLQHQEVLSDLPDNMEFLNWYYDENPKEEDFAFFGKIGKPQVVCPGTSSWWGIAEVPAISEQNISRMAEYGHRYGAVGMLNTNWGDFGHLASIELAMYGLIVGAETSWSVATEINEDFRNKVNALLYQNNHAAEYLYELGELQRDDRNSLWKVLCAYYEKRTCNPNRDEQRRPSEKTLKDHQARAMKLIEKLKGETWENSLYHDQFLLAAEGTLIIIEMLAKILGYSMQRYADVSVWLGSYKAAWMRDNKENEYGEIEKVFTYLDTME